MLSLNSLSEQEILKFAVDNGIIQIDTIQKQIEMNERIKYLEMHQSKIWQSTDGKWYTYLPDIEKGRRLLKRKSEKEIVDEVIKYYKENQAEPTIDDVFHEWIERKLQYGEIQKQTYDRYLIDYRRFYENTNFSKRKVQYLDENSLEDFIMECISKKKLTSKAYGNLRIITRGMLMYAKKRKYTTFNANIFFNDLELSSKIFTKNYKADEEIVFSKDEIQKIIAFLEAEKPKITNLGVLIAIYTGMRVGEIVALKWEDIHENYIHINRRQVMYNGEDDCRIYEVKDCPKTEAGIRDVVIVPEVEKYLKRAKHINPFTKYVFEKNGKPITIHTLSMVLYRACDKLNIPRRGMHSLRKTYATTLINAGVDESIVINQMGHTNIKTTKDYYYYNNKTKDKLRDIIADAVSF